jgi:hypothetical protein
LGRAVCFVRIEGKLQRVSLCTRDRNPSHWVIGQIIGDLWSLSALLWVSLTQVHVSAKSETIDYVSRTVRTLANGLSCSVTSEHAMAPSSIITKL